MNTSPTARQQFADDISLVLDNDRESYEIIQAEAKRLMAQEEFINSANWLLATYIKDYVETAIENAIGNNLIGALLIRQLCFGWGIDPYYDYASSITATLRESVAI